MRNLRTGIIVVLALAAGALAGCAARPAPEVDDTPPDGQVRVYEVFGMDCPGCHGGLEKLVKALPGVTGARAEWEQKKLTVYVSGEPEVSDADVEGAIRRANFTPGERRR